MYAVARRLVLFTLFATAAAYGVFIVADAVIYAQEKAKQRVVWIRDAISPGVHRLAGTMTLPNSCTHLTVKTHKLSDVAYKLAFKTWEDPNLQCDDEPAHVAFREIVFAPATGITFIATLDDLPLPIIVVPTIQ